MADKMDKLGKMTGKLMDKLLGEEKATKKATVSKKEYTEVTERQTKSVKKLAESQVKAKKSTSKITDAERELLNTLHQKQQTQLDIERHQFNEKQAKETLKLQKAQEKLRIAQEKLAIKEKQRIEDLYVSQAALQTQADLEKFNAKELEKATRIKEKNIQGQKIANLAIKKHISLQNQERANRKKDLDALKKDILARAEQNRKIKESNNLLHRLFNVQKQVAKQTLLSVRNQRNLNGSLSKFRSQLLIVSFGVGLVRGAVNGLVGEYADYEAALKRVESVLISTGGVSNQTKNSIMSLATSIQEATGVSDTLVMSSSALLATFTQISGDTFPAAQKAIVDMTAAMNAGKVTQEGLKSSTIQVGKALNNPVKGLTALSRVGVLFTKQQKENIKSLVNLGKVSEAQAIILEELNKEFGNVASADSYEKSIRTLDSAIGDLQKEIGSNLMPVVKVLVEGLTSLTNALNPQRIMNFTIALAGSITVGKLVQSVLILLSKSAWNLSKALVAVRVGLSTLGGGALGVVIAGLTAVGYGVLQLTDRFKNLNDPLEKLIDNTKKYKNEEEALTDQIIQSNALKVYEQDISAITAQLNSLQSTAEAIGSTAVTFEVSSEVPDISNLPENQQFSIEPIVANPNIPENQQVSIEFNPDPDSIENFKVRFEKVMTDMPTGWMGGTVQKEVDQAVPQIVRLADGYEFYATTLEDVERETKAYLERLIQQKDSIEINSKAAEKYLKILENQREARNSEKVEELTKKYQEQSDKLTILNQIVADGNSQSSIKFKTEEELIKVANTLNISTDQLKDKYEGLAGAIEQVIVKQNKLKTKKVTQDYKDQLTILNEKNILEKELMKQSLSMGLSINTLSNALKTGTGDYKDLAESIEKVIETQQKKKMQDELINQAQETANAFIMAELNAQSEAQQRAMQSDIDAAKTRSDYKLAQARGDSKAMAKIEEEAAKKTLKKRKELFRMNQALAMSNLVIDYLQAQGKEVASKGIFGLTTAAILNVKLALALATVAAQKPPSFEMGGLVGGKRHSQGGTMIEAERGEFVMSRSAVQTAGVETMNRINQGLDSKVSSNITVNVSGNVMSQDYVEDTLAEQIRDAVRRGTDFGVN